MLNLTITLMTSSLCVTTPNTCSLSYLQVEIVPRLTDKVALVPQALHDKNQASLSDSASAREVTHLAGVSLYIKYSPFYPSHSAPECHLSACWMELQGISSVVQHMQEMFLPDCLVVYQWITYLQDDMVLDYIKYQSLARNMAAENLKVREPIIDSDVTYPVITFCKLHSELLGLFSHYMCEHINFCQTLLKFLL